MTIQEILHALSHEYGNTQAEIAARIGINQANVSRLMSGVHEDTNYSTAVRALSWLEELRAASNGDSGVGDDDARE